MLEHEIEQENAAGFYSHRCEKKHSLTQFFIQDLPILLLLKSFYVITSMSENRVKYALSMIKIVEVCSYMIAQAII